MNDSNSILAEHLAPPVPGLRLIRLVPLSNRFLVHATATGASAACPRCGALSQRVHSHYQRTLADLPWGSWPVHLVLRVRKFFCSTPSCPQRTFAERLPTLTAPYARRVLLKPEGRPAPSPWRVTNVLQEDARSGRGGPTVELDRCAPPRVT